MLVSMPLKEYETLTKIVGNKIEDEYSLSSIISHKNVMIDILIYGAPTSPPELIRSCTLYNCVCWKYNIKKFCARYNVCMVCYMDDCVRCTDSYDKKCSNIKK